MSPLSPHPQECSTERAQHTTIIHKGMVVTPGAVLQNTDVVVHDGVIVALGDAAGREANCHIDAQGCYVLPGIVDVHSDALEKYMEPRPGVLFPHELAIVEFDKYLAGCGITTMYHCVCLMHLPKRQSSVRAMENSVAIIDELHRLAPGLRVNTKIHLRYDLPSVEALPLAHELVAQKRVDMLSLMDHTPGQGQYPDAEDFVKRRALSVGEENARHMLLEQRSRQQRIDSVAVQQLLTLAREQGIAIASHDDDCEEKVRWAHEQEIAISEFPVTREAMVAAQQLGMHCCMGAPNVIRGGSHSNNQCATQAVAHGYADILCSDYAPMTMMHAVFKLSHQLKRPLHEMMALVSINPAKAAHIDKRTGSLEVGKDADLLIVNYRHQMPHIRQVLVGGRRVLSLQENCSQVRSMEYSHETVQNSL